MEITYKGKTYKIKELKYGDYRKMVRTRKEALDTKDDNLMIEAIAVWLKTITDASDEDIDDLTLSEIMDFTKRISEIQSIPLQPSVKLAEQSSVITPSL